MSVLYPLGLVFCFSKISIMKFVFILAFFIVFPSFILEGSDTLKVKKWEIAILTDPFYSQYFFLENTDARIDISRQTGGALYRTNSLIQFSRNISPNIEIVAGLPGFPKLDKYFPGSNYYLGTRFSKQKKWINYRYAAGLIYEGGRAANYNLFGAKSTISAAYIWKNIVVISFEYNVSLLYEVPKNERKNVCGLFLDDYPKLRLGVRL